MQDYISMAGGFLRNVDAREQCQYCQLDSTDQFLRSIDASWDTRWRDFGLVWVYVVFNIVGAISFYWLFRVPKGKKVKSA